jgi:hypothetical protein
VDTSHTDFFPNKVTNVKNMRKISHTSAKYGFHSTVFQETHEEIPYIEFCPNQSKMWKVWTNLLKPTSKVFLLR